MQIVWATVASKEELERSKEIPDKVLSEVIMIDDNDATLTKALDSYWGGVHSDIRTMRRKISVIYKRKPNEMMTILYNTVSLNLMKSNMNLQFVKKSMYYWHIYVHIFVKKKMNFVKLKEGCRLKCERKIEKNRKCLNKTQRFYSWSHNDETNKKSIQDKDTKQHHERRKNLDETTKKRIS